MDVDRQIAQNSRQELSNSAKQVLHADDQLEEYSDKKAYHKSSCSIYARASLYSLGGFFFGYG